MKLTPFQLGLLAIGGFASIVMLNVLAKYQSNQDFRETLSQIKPSDLIPMRTRLIREEQMQAPEPTPIESPVEYEEVDNV
jgi:hypothetical protein